MLRIVELSVAVGAVVVALAVGITRLIEVYRVFKPKALPPKEWE